MSSVRSDIGTYVLSPSGVPVRETTLGAIAQAVRPIFTNDPAAGMRYVLRWTGDDVIAPPVPLPEPATPKPVAPLKSYIDTEHGVEWIPLKSIGWPKRMVILRREPSPAEWFDTNAWLAHVEKRLASVDAYTRAPIRWLTRHQSLEVLRPDVALITRT